ncbi:MAG TPA: lipid II flippase MurJ, partial [Gemmatimonadales bacterium]|nr:lipid II flippase MurJ [Gemmatimonadales bacterium]
VQVSSIVDTQLASLLGGGAVAALGYAQLVSTLPLSLFGVSVAAAALPDMSRDAAAQAHGAIRQRLAEALRQLSFFALPSAFALASLSGATVGALFQTGSFGGSETDVVGGVLAAYAIGIPAQASVKLLASGHYAVGDTRTPVKVAAISVALSAALSWALMRWFGAAGIALGASAGSYVNLALNYASLRRRFGPLGGGAEWRALAVCALAATLAAQAAGLAAGWAGPASWPALVGGLLSFGVAYGSVCVILRHPDAGRLLIWTRRR